jgi:hypothetical protein
MTTTLIILSALIVWWVIGYQGFKFWWTHTRDFTTDDLGLAAMAGLLGPIAWLVGWWIHGEPGKTRVIAKQRKFQSNRLH